MKNQNLDSLRAASISASRGCAELDQARQNLNPLRFFSLSCSIEPYISQRGTVRASYQWLNADGYAVAVCNLTASAESDGTQIAATVPNNYESQREEFLCQALAHFKAMPPKWFGQT